MKNSNLAEDISAFIENQGQSGVGSIRENWRTLGRLGFFQPFSLGSPTDVPEGLEETVRGLEILGRNQNMMGLAFSAGAHMFAAMSSLRKFGTEEQRHRWLPGMARGDLIGAFAVAEMKSSSDVFALECKARFSDGGYVLNGHKAYITNATICDLVLVFAVDDAAGKVVCAVVEREARGMEPPEAIDTEGLAGSSLGRINLRDCFVPRRDVLAVGQRAKLVFLHAMAWERGLILAPAVGMMQRQIESCVRHTRGRTQNGSPLLHLQAVRHRLADMQKRHYTAAVALQDFLVRKLAGHRAFREASFVKMIISDACLNNSLDAIRLYGAFGYTSESRAQQDLLDAIAFQTASGTNDIQKNIVAQWLTTEFI